MKSWLSVLVQAYRKSREDRSTDMAASLAFYCLFSLFPLLVGVVGIALYFVDAEALEDKVAPALTNAFPGTGNLIEDNVAALVRLRASAGLVGAAGLVWSASKVFGALQRGINQALDMRPPHGKLLKPLRQIAISLAASVGLLVAIVGTAMVGLVPTLGGTVVQIVVSHAVSLLLMTAFLLGLYSLIPYHRLSLRAVRGPAMFAAALLELSRSVFVFYLENLTELRLVYGSLTSVIILLLWLYFCGRIVLFGAEVIAVQRREADATNVA